MSDAVGETLDAPELIGIDRSITDDNSVVLVFRDSRGRLLDVTATVVDGKDQRAAPVRSFGTLMRFSNGKLERVP